MKNFKKMSLLALSLIITTGILVGCSKDEESNPIASINIKGYGTISAELYPEKAPNTVNNFINLAEKGFYKDLIIHRVVPDFVIQGGDPKGDGTGSPGYSIKGEFASNNYKENDISHTKGTLSMARSTDKDSAGSQFFITLEDATYLDGEYAGFGKVIGGMDVAEKIEKAPVNELDKPSKDIIIESITIDKNGYKNDKVEKIRK